MGAFFTVFFNILLIILLALLLTVIIALFLSVTVDVRLGKDIIVKIKYAGITVFSIQPETEEEKAKARAKAKKKSPKKIAAEKKKVEKAKQIKAQKAEEKKAKKEEQKKNKPKKTLDENLELVKNLLSSLSKPAKRLFSHIRVTNVNADITVSGKDAASAALNYGRMSVLINAVLSLLYTTVRLSVDNIDLGVDFQSGETAYDISFKVKLRISTALGCAVWFLFRMAKRTLAGRKKKGGTPKVAVEKGT
ncbi:MAG: hypothetical protein J1E39_03035 [Eubacterium sp.]|nr:hypothetical protein [Eubacterium sp.]